MTTEPITDADLAAIGARYSPFTLYPFPDVYGDREQVRDDILALLADLRQARAERDEAEAERDEWHDLFLDCNKRASDAEIKLYAAERDVARLTAAGTGRSAR